MERQQIINIAKIVTNIFLAVAILLLVWQFLKANEIAKDIALSDSPTTIIDTYENITGQECVCGFGLYERLGAVNMKVNSYEPSFNLSTFSTKG